MEVDQIADEILWARVLAGEPAAYADLYRRHADRVFTHCFRRLADRTDAEDVTAEAFAEVWRQRDRVQLDDEAGLLPWLLGTANNLLRRHQRERISAGRVATRLRVDRHSDDHADDVAADLDDISDLRQLALVLSSLRERDREVIHLCVIEGLTPTAVARTFGEPAGTVRARLSRALERARAAMRELHTHSDGGES